MPSTSTLVDRVKIFILSNGTGPFVLGSAVPAYRGREALIDGAQYSYAAESDAKFEAGVGTYDATAGTLIRSPEISSNGGAAENFPANTQLSFTALAQDLIAIGGTLPIVDALGTAADKAISQRAATDGINSAIGDVSNLAPKANPIFTGSITVDGARPLTFTPSSGLLKTLGDSGGWDIGSAFAGPNGNVLGKFGAKGANNSLDYLYMGPAYDNANSLRVYPTYAAWGANPLWHSGNFNPANYAALAGATFAGNVTAGAGGALAQIRSDGDVKAYRAGGATGALFLSQDNTRYLYNDGSTYHLNAQGLAVTGPVVSEGTELAKNNLNNLTGAIRTINLNYQGSGNNALIHDKTLVFAPNVAPAANDVANAMFLRQVAYSGGTPGFTNNALKVLTEVSNAGAAAFEWAFLAVLDNNASAGENTAAYMQAIKRNTGPTFANTIEVIEPTTVNNPTSGTVAQEVDMSVNGTDNNFCRIGSDLVVRKYNSSGPDAVSGYGFRIQNGGYANSLVRIGFGLAANMKAEIGFDTAIGITPVAMRIGEGQVVQLEVSGVHTMSFTAAAGGLRYSVFGVDSHVLEAQGSHYMKPIAASALPAAGKAGRIAFVTGLASTARDAVVASGGSGARLCQDDGGSWRVI